MRKKLIALFSAITLLIAIMPHAMANPNFVGAYRATLIGGPASENYAQLVVSSCTDSTINIQFKFVKNNNETYSYECFEGTMTDSTHATVPFIATKVSTGTQLRGTMQLTLLASGAVTVYATAAGIDPLIDVKHMNRTNDVITDTQPPVINNQPSVPDTSLKVKLNGELVSFKNNMGPMLLNDHTYVPLRSVFDSMGINVFWDQYQKNSILNAQLITCTKNDTILQFARTFNETGYNVWTLSKWVNEDTSSANKTDVNINDLQPIIIESTSYVPLRVISEAFGADVSWDAEARTAVINCDTSNAYKYDSSIISGMESFSMDTAKTAVTEDFTSIVPDQTPYFSKESKFYLFNAIDQYGGVVLKTTYGTNTIYLDVVSTYVQETPAAETASPAPSEEPVSSEEPKATDDIKPEDTTSETAPIEQSDDAPDAVQADDSAE